MTAPCTELPGPLPTEIVGDDWDEDDDE